MSHPFDLNLSALESIKLNFAEEITDEEAATVVGGRHGHRTPKVKEEDPIFTTLAIGEEGGGRVTTLALGEEGGHYLY